MKTLIAAALAILLGFTSAVRLQQGAATHSLPDGSFVQIFGASYGPEDVTHKVRQFYQSGVKTIQASNAVFGDPWPGFGKTLHVTYRHCEKT